MHRFLNPFLKNTRLPNTYIQIYFWVIKRDGYTRGIEISFFIEKRLNPLEMEINQTDVVHIGDL